MKTFWLKELIDRKLFLPSGAPVPFEAADGTYGILETEDPGMSSELEKAMKNHVGGVIQITEADFGEWKKKALSLGSQPPLPRDRESLGPIPLEQLQQLRSRGPAAVVTGVDAAGNVQPALNPVIASPGRAEHQATSQKVPPIDVPTAFQVPRVGKPAAAKKASPPPSPGKPT